MAGESLWVLTPWNAHCPAASPRTAQRFSPCFVRHSRVQGPGAESILSQKEKAPPGQQATEKGLLCHLVGFLYFFFFF